ncbi:MAG: RNA polymerase-binding protein RbpA [Actinomycetales bacterium]|nr:RNA polymerase-binding protein RbpA [Actinomycetales bacterium]
MMERTLRGMRLGSISLESEANVELAPRMKVLYDCPDGHVTAVPMAVEAEIPTTWECRCGVPALRRNHALPEAVPGKPARTHWDMLRERRSIAELEVLLTERLAQLREIDAELDRQTA